MILRRRAAAMLAAVLALLYPAAAPALEARLVDARTGAPPQEGYAVAGGVFAAADASGLVRLEAPGGVLFVRAPGYRAASVTGADIAADGGVVRLAPFKPKALYLTVYGIGSKSLREGALSLIRKGAANALVIDL
ncbi:MAG TPA: hypothetical protein VG939_20070, partial [Caulobacteraceae bacterium]|nr:hypothetical protein [Caulobacteraceae bacterium]